MVVNTSPSSYILHHRDTTRLRESPALAIQQGCLLAREFVPHVRLHVFSFSLTVSLLLLKLSDSHVCFQSLPVPEALNSSIRKLCEGIVARAHALAQELSSLSADALANKWVAPAEKGEIGPIMSQLSSTNSSEAFVELFLSISRVVESLLREEQTVVDVRPPVKIFGDIHGQLQDLLRLFCCHGFPIAGSGGDVDVVTYIFNGDFVDRGPHQLEVLLLLYSLKILHPSRIVLLRGNHETSAITFNYGYSAECHRVSCYIGTNCPLYNASLVLFQWLPVAAVVSGAVLVLHGGIGDGLWSLDALRATHRPITDDILDDESCNRILANVLWSDPIDGDETLPQNRNTQVRTMCRLMLRPFFITVGYSSLASAVVIF
jgi:hypothetical protein